MAPFQRAVSHVVVILLSCSLTAEGRGLEIRRGDWYTKLAYNITVPQLSMPELKPNPDGVNNSIIPDDIPKRLAHKMEKATLEWIKKAMKPEVKIVKKKVRSNKLGFKPSDTDDIVDYVLPDPSNWSSLGITGDLQQDLRRKGCVNNTDDTTESAVKESAAKESAAQELFVSETPEECGSGAESVSQEECMPAVEAMAKQSGISLSTRGLQTGSGKPCTKAWSHVPLGCSIEIVGKSWTPHYKTTDNPDPDCDIKKSYRVICVKEATGLVQTSAGGDDDCDSQKEARRAAREEEEELQIEGERILREMQSSGGLGSASLAIPEAVLPYPNPVPANPLNPLLRGKSSSRASKVGGRPGDIVDEIPLIRLQV